MELKNSLKIKYCLVILLSLIAISCTPIALNTGATDYAITNTKAIDSDGRVALKSKYKNNDTDELTVKKGESISVTLQHAFIKDFSERLERITSKLSYDSVRGEIAILAKVYEQDDGTHIDHTMSGIKNSGRLIYYSEDVRSGGHPLNFSQLPIYGPIEYNGNTLVLQLTILELDIAESNQLKGILNTLASMGKKAYAPSSAILEVLDTVGSNLLSGDQDDLEFSYSFTLHPSSGHPDVKDAKLIVGDYILLKKSPLKIKRPIGPPFDNINWKEFKFDQNNGRLLQEVKNDEGSSWENFTDESYMVIQINTGLPSIGLDVAQAFSELESELSGEVNNTEFIENLTKSVDKFKIISSEKLQKEDIKKLFSQAMNRLQEYSNEKDKKIKKAALAAYFDIVVKKKGFPEPIPSQSKPPIFEQYQWNKMLSKLRDIAVNPFNINQDNIEKSADYTALEMLLK